MANRNDAIPSWSGFTYQGKITLLVALQLLNAHPHNHTEFSIEIEKTEDFVILHYDEAVAFYQVKAYPTKHTRNPYITPENALQKLIDHRRQSPNAHRNAQCYLCAINNIKDWDTPANVYKQDISLYTYNSKFIGLLEVIEYIKVELQNLMVLLPDLVGANVDIMYGELCAFIDSQVMQMHSEGKGRNHRISLSDVLHILIAAKDRADNDFSVKLQESAYCHIADKINTALHDFCRRCSDYPGAEYTGNCNTCGVTRYYDLVSNIPSIPTFCKILNPSILEWNSGFSYSDSLPTAKFESRIYDVSKQVPPNLLIDCMGNSIYIESAAFWGKRAIPTLLEFDDYHSDSQTQDSIEEILQKITNNAAALPFINNSSLVVYFGPKARSIMHGSSIRNQSITCFKDFSSSPYKPEDNIRPEVQINLIEIEDIVKQTK